MTPARRNRGATLVELLVVLAILAVSAAVVGLAVVEASGGEEMDPVGAEVARLRRSAIAEGRARTVWIRTDTGAGWVTVLPTGAVVADSTVHHSMPSAGSEDEF